VKHLRYFTHQLLLLFFSRLEILSKHPDPSCFAALLNIETVALSEYLLQSQRLNLIDLLEELDIAFDTAGVEAGKLVLLLLSLLCRPLLGSILHIL